MGFAHRVLADVEAKEVEPDAPLVWGECMTDRGLTRFQFQTHVLQPGRRELLTPLDNAAIGMEDDEVG